MRVNLRLNFGKIESLVNESESYANSVLDMQEALNKLLAVIDSNKGMTAEELKNKPLEINTQINKLTSGAQSMSDVLAEFCVTMTEIIKPQNSDMDMFIETNDVKKELKALSNSIQELNNIKNKFELPDLSIFNYIGEDENTYEDYEHIKSTLLRVSEIKEEYNIVTSGLANTYIDMIDVIYNKVENFENTDDEFENKGELIYENWLDLKWYETTTSKIIFGVVGVAACIILICFAGPVVGVATTALGLSTSASAITGAVVSVAKGGLMAAAATSVIDVSVAVFMKEDIDNKIGSALCEGLITGVITTGFVEAAPLIVKGGASLYTKLADIGNAYVPNITNQVIKQGANIVNVVDDLLGEKGQIILQNKDRVIKGTAKVAGDVIGEKLAKDYIRKDYNFFLSLGKAIGGQGVDYGKDMLLERLDILKESMDISQKFDDGVFMGYRGFLNILDGDSNEIFIDDISIDDINNNSINIETRDSFQEEDY